MSAPIGRALWHSPRGDVRVNVLAFDAGTATVVVDGYECSITAKTSDLANPDECENACAWVAPYGWVPEAGCEIHDGVEGERVAPKQEFGQAVGVRGTDK